jgi:hypothetical protein
MSSLTDPAETRALDWLTGNTTTAPTGALKVALVTANGSDAAAGSEVSGGSYARQTVTFSAASAGSTSNTGALTWTNMPACTVVGIEVWDSAGTPIRWWWGPLASSKVVNVGDTFTILAGSLTLSMA